MIELKKLDDVPESEQNTLLYRWARLIAAKDWKEVCEVASGDTYMEAARDVLDKMNQDRVERYLYLRREMAYTDEISRMQTAENLGLKQGMAQGLEQGVMSLIETCAELGVSREDTLARLLDKLEISEESARGYMQKYWKA